MVLTFPLSFPNFNLYSTPLLVLVLQGLIFSFLLFGKYIKTKDISYAILGLILLITCYHRTTYTIGFMDWYDTYRNTKINYYLINLGFIVVPLVYLYVRSITSSDFKLKRKHLWHFLPGIIYIVIKLVILVYDANQPGFKETQNGYLVQNFQWKYVDPFQSVLSYIQIIIYLVLSLQLYFNYRRNIQQYFSNMYQLELNWMRGFLFVYAALFLYDIGQTMVNLTITELSWTQKWWLHFFNALAIIYIGVKGYFTNTDRLKGLEFDGNTTIGSVAFTGENSENEIVLPAEVKDLAEKIEQYFQIEKPHLDPDLNLISLSKTLKANRADISEAINSGLGKNFNDYVNHYRVQEVKKMLLEGKQQQLSLLGIALECGFNSKATFNRVFKKMTGQSPSQFVSTL